MSLLHPSLLARHVIVRTTLASAVVLGLALLVTVALEAVFRIDSLVRGDLPEGASRFSTILSFYLLRLPSLASPLIPLAVVAGALITLAPMLRRREVVALAAAGIGLRRVASPLLIVGLAAGILDFILIDGLAPRFEGRRTVIEDSLEGYVRQGRIWIDDDTGTAWYADRVKLDLSQELVFHKIAAATSDGGLTTAEQLVWNEAQGWQLNGVIAWRPDGDGSWQLKRQETAKPDGDLYLSEDRQALIGHLLSQQAMTTAALLDRGRPLDQSTAFGRFLHLILPLSALLLAVPGFLRFANADSVIAAGITALGCAALPLVLAAVTPQLATMTRLPPVMGAMLAAALTLAPGGWRWWRWNH